MRKRYIAVILIVLGLALVSVPFLLQIYGSYQTRQLLQEITHEIETETEQETDEERETKEEQTTTDETENAALSVENGIGIIEIEALELTYPIVEGADSSNLAYAIGHIPDTAGIGEQGNCVLAGHRGSRYGTYFKYLNRLKEGDVVTLTNAEGSTFHYEVQDSWVAEPYDNSVKNQGEETELTLLTCENSGTQRLIVRCVLKEGEQNETEISTW